MEKHTLIAFEVKLTSDRGFSQKDVMRIINKIGKAAIGRSKYRRVRIGNPYNDEWAYNEGEEY